LNGFASMVFLHWKISILWCCQNMEWTSLLHSPHRDSQKTHMECLIRNPDEGFMPLERCSAVETSDSSRGFRRPGLLTRIRTSNPCWDFRRSGLLTQVRTSDPCRDFRHMSGLPANLIKRVVRIWPSGFWSELF
jgi:hypothetical protein